MKILLGSDRLSHNRFEKVVLCLLFLHGQGVFCMIRKHPKIGSMDEANSRNRV